MSSPSRGQIHLECAGPEAVQVRIVRLPDAARRGVNADVVDSRGLEKCR